jgi:phthalate 4,5-cis-dihydrodiol dehydrogenase
MIRFTGATLPSGRENPAGKEDDFVSSPPVLRLGFIGVGQAVNRMFQSHNDISKLPFRMAGAADLRPHALERFARDFQCETFASAEELCRSSSIDAVYVATPPEYHREHVELAAAHGKHAIVEKPMALTLADCDAMVTAAEKAGVKLVAGHTHSFDAPIRKMQEVIAGGTLGNLVMLNTWNFNDFNHRPWPTPELHSTFGPLLNQGPHQVDIVRQLGGGMVKSVRAQTIPDIDRRTTGGWTCFLEFENGIPATLVYDARAYFDTAELFWWIGEGGTKRAPDMNVSMRRNLRELGEHGPEERERLLAAQKEQGRYGATYTDPDLHVKLRGYHSPEPPTHQPFFGLTVASCDRGAIRQSADGLFIYDDDGVHEIPVDRSSGGRVAELMDLYDGVVNGKRIFHDGRWGRATLEVCLAIAESARAKRDVELKFQVPMPVEPVPAGAVR